MTRAPGGIFLPMADSTAAIRRGVIWTAQGNSIGFGGFLLMVSRVEID
jgi:hypothetical protein